MYTLKEGINHALFLQTVKDCAGEVLFKTQEGDVLNLKSTLSQFVFAASLLNPMIADGAEVYCANPDDYVKLEEFLQGMVT